MATLKVGGMTCDGCVRSVHKAVERVSPGAAAQIDRAAGTVTLAEGLDLAVIAEAIRKAGYEVQG